MIRRLHTSSILRAFFVFSNLNIFMNLSCYHFAVVSDAAAGGQVLMCAATFKAVKDQTGELGCVTKDGMQADRMATTSWKWWRWGFKAEGNNTYLCYVLCLCDLLSLVII